MTAVFRFFENILSNRLFRLAEFPTGISPVRLALHYINDLRSILAITIAIGIAYAVLELSGYYLFGRLVDALAAPNGADPFQLLILATLVLGILSPILSITHSLLVWQTMSSSVLAMAQWQVHRAVISQDLTFFTNGSSGQTSSRVNNAVNAIRTMITLLSTQLPLGLVQFVGSIILVATISPVLAIPVVIWFAGNGFVGWFVAPRYSTNAVNIAHARGVLFGRLTDIYAHAATIKLFSGERREDESVKAFILDFLGSQRRLAQSITVIGTLFSLTNTLLILSMLWLGWSLTSSGQLSVGEFAAAAAISFRLTANIEWFVAIGQSLVELYGSLKDSSHAFSAKPTIHDGALDAPTFTEGDSIEFKNVSFGYGQDDAVSLNGVSFKIRYGEKIGIVGTSGSGKSTVIKLLGRLYDPDFGSITLSGHDVKEFSLASLRRQFSFVDQDAPLLNRSVLDNVTYGTEATDEHSVRAALADAGVLEVVESLKGPNGETGLNAMVGEKGAKLSGGERQRLAIARALLRRSPILVLDEATAALDSRTEADIQQKLSERSSSSTIIAIAHRLSTISSFDRILVFESGRIVEQGSHAELLAKDGTYSSLWRQQMSGDGERPPAATTPR